MKRVNLIPGRPIAKLGSIRNSEGKISLWRLPNFLFEASGRFLGECDDLIHKLGRWRALIGFVLIVGITLRFQGSRVFGYTYLPKHSPTQHVVLPFESAEVITVGVAAALTLVIALVVAILLVFWARPAARRATVIQMRWPAITMGVFTVFMAIMIVLFVKVIPTLEGRYAYEKSSLRFLWIFVILIAWLVLAFLLLKSLYLVITGLFRADDGHPLLAPIAYPLASIAMAGWASVHSGSHTLPAPVVVLSLWLGPVTALVLSAWAVLRMRRKYPEFPFRDGPLVESALPGRYDTASATEFPSLS